jgi:5-amino-6-(5-phospho-D-ribitylamino)uracil phosphatase
MDRPFFVSDLDGTLMGTDGRLSAFAREALARLIDAGVALTVASARSVQSMRPLLGDVPFRMPVVAMNGALLTDWSAGRHVEIRAIPAGAVAEVLAIAAPTGLDPFVTSHDGEQDNLYLPEPGNGGMAWYVEERRRVRDPRLRDGYAARRWLRERIVTVTYIGPHETLALLARAIEESIPDVTQAFTPHIYTQGRWHWLTVLARDANKAAAVQRLRALRGLDGHRLVAFGDQANDMPLLAYADHSVAVANADAEVRAAVDEVIGSNAEDAVVRYMLAAAGIG